MNEKLYSGYYCNKCHFIPLIKIIPKNSDIKVYSSCKCRNQYENMESFLKNKYRKDIMNINNLSKESPNNEHNKLSFSKSTLDNIIKNFKEKKAKIIEEGINIKNKLINIFERKIQEVNEMYLKYSEKNNKIIIIIEHLIQSYELVEDNKSNIFNILNNCKFKDIRNNQNYFEKYKDLESLSKDIEDYFKNKYIISNLDTSISLENIHSYYSAKKIKNIIELNNDICAYCSEIKNSISIIDFNKSEKEIFTFEAHSKNIEYIIKSNMNNIISYGNDKMIKMWPIIDGIFLSEIRGKNINNSDNKKNIFKDKEIKFNLNPLFSYNIEKEENFNKIINLKENRFLMSFKNNSFLLFKYSINHIEFIQSYEYKNQIFLNLLDVFIFQKENIEYISLYNNSNIHFLELAPFKLIKSLSVKYMTKNSMIQINSNELLIADGYNIKLIDINNFSIKLTIKNEEKKVFLLNLNDGTFILSTGVDVKRYFIKTMEELLLLDQSYYEDNYDDTLDYNNYTDDIINYIYKLNSGKIISCYNNGRFTLGYLKYN